jgi:hypothetical protein
MPCTAIKFQKDGRDVRLKFMTVINGEQLDVDAFACDENFIPVSGPEMTTMLMDEEEYHRNLRKDAHERGHFVKEESTNPEWNPSDLLDGASGNLEIIHE